MKAKLGVLPRQVIDFKALCGDKSDNIPGVKGIGEKTAVQLLDAHDSLTNIYAVIDQIKGATQKKLIEGKEDAFKSQFLASIKLDVPLEIDLEDCKLTGFDQNLLVPLLSKLELKKLLGKINEIQQQFGGEVAELPSVEPLASSELSHDQDEDMWFFSASDTAAAANELEASPIQPQIINTEDKLTELVN